MTNEALVASIRSGVDVAKNMFKLWEQNQNFIAMIAARFQAYEDIEDLKQEGYIGLCHAVEGYNLGEGVSFIYYAAFWIKQSMQRYIENCGAVVRIPTHTRQRLNKYRKLCRAFELHHGRKPTDREIGLFMGISQSEVEQLKKDAVMGQIGSLDKPVKGLEDSELTVRDTIAGTDDVEGSVLDEIQRQQLKEVLWSVVDALPGTMPQVLKMRYQEGATLEAAGRSLGINREKARQYESKALRLLRLPYRSDKLRPFLYSDGTYSRALKGCGVTRFNQTWTSSTEYVALGMNRDE